MLRKLGIFERALFLSDQHVPFNVISVLRLENGPTPEVLQHVLAAVRQRHPLLRAAIKNGAFVESSAPGLNFTVVERQHANQWMEIVECEMNTRLSPERELFRSCYVFDQQNSELVLTFHHAIMDATSGMELLDEILTRCSSSVELPTCELLPAVEERFPAAFMGWRGLLAVMSYASAQMADEISYWLHVRGRRVPPVKLGGRGFAGSLTMPAAFTDALTRRSRQEKVTFNSLLNAALLLAVNRLLYEGRQTPMRTFTFANLRPYTSPPTPSIPLANYTAMMRFTQDAAGSHSVWRLARNLQNQIVPALKRGDKFIAVTMSEPLMKMFLALKTMRMGSVGLNHAGAVPLKSEYGQIQVRGVHGFLSSFDIGPEVSAQVRLFNDALCWDFMFLDTDMARDQAADLIHEVQVVLEQAVSLDQPVITADEP